MANIPDAQALPQAQPQPAGGIAAFEPPNWRQVGMVGQTIQEAGSKLDQASDIIAQANARQDDLMAQSASNSLTSERVNLQFDPKIGFANAKEGQAVGPQFIDNYLQRFDTAAQGLRDKLQGPDQQRVFDQHMQIQRNAYTQALLEHQAQQTDRFNDSTDDATIKNSLSDMAQRPQDELGFQRNLIAINATIKSQADRKGLPPQAVDQLQQHYLDAAYGTRILSIANGLPGVSAANPYLAERMFDQVQGMLGPQARLQLAGEVQRAIVPVQQRDLAQQIVMGKPPLMADALAPATQGTAPLTAGVIKAVENSPNGAVSPKGAEGDMQVLPSTQTNPGFGVTPARTGPDGKPLPGEIDRVGRDFLGAMTARYDNPALVLAAYNAGPGTVDRWIQRFGDPRIGQTSTADWVSKIPYKETADYVHRGLGMIGGESQTSAPPVTAAQLKTQLPAMAEQARTAWMQMYPNDVVGADGAATRVLNYGGLVVAGQVAKQDGARDTLLQAIVADGAQKPTTMDALLSNPATKAAWEQASPQVQLEIQEKMKQGGGVQRTPATQALTYQLVGEFSNNRQAFADKDLTPYISQLPNEDFNHVRDLQVAARSKVELAQEKSINLQRAMSLSETMVLKPAGIFIPTKDTPQAKRQIYDQFTGALQDELSQFYAKNQRQPNDDEVVKMARGLTTTVQVPGRLWGTTDVHAFQIDASNQGAVTVNVPPEFRTNITTAFQSKGVKPTEAQIQTAYLASLRTAPRAK